jgi:hypothetical protein
MKETTDLLGAQGFGRRGSQRKKYLYLRQGPFYVAVLLRRMNFGRQVCACPVRRIFSNGVHCGEVFKRTITYKRREICL